MMEISERIEVPAPPSAVWAVLSDPQAVVECVPGASLGEAHDDGFGTGGIGYGGGLVGGYGRHRISLSRAIVALSSGGRRYAALIPSTIKFFSSNTKMSSGKASPPCLVIELMRTDRETCRE